ncbi:hypothetical protein DIURU_005190 [Diutina rugosa]|uniref:CFEM domain-containing protein n=1 Tax=Diutina rugosa TaxID=5481 RepID=A0A642UH04_DIURU|nr:uncharacterized protein DIURU_005190 [Diutina rugosa]KAA8897591.1 hypothetical protein DIURU_005190 [Diutina rugosa]
MLFNVLLLAVSVMADAQAAVTAANDFTVGDFRTYPKVPKTATFNGFADPIIDKLPDCAKECVKEDTGSTPCPYWDTGCFCVMPQWAGPVNECFAKCENPDDVKLATSLAYSLCTSVGANTMMMPGTVSELVQSAANRAVSGGDAKSTDDKSETASNSGNSNSGSNSGSDTARETTTSSGSESKSSASSASATGSSSSKAGVAAAGVGAAGLAAAVGFVGLLL